MSEVKRYCRIGEMLEPHVKRPYRVDAPLPASVVDSMGFLLKAYTSPPAPVSVVLPEREMYCQYLIGIIPSNRLEVEAYKDGLNACLDELKRLNPSL